MCLRHSANGYTLIELMIVAAILSILAAIALPMYNGYITTARQTAALANIEPLRLAIEDYRLDHMDTGYAGLNGVWEPSGANTLETGPLRWKPDGDNDRFNYAVTGAAAATYTITVTPIGHAADAQSFTK